MTATTIIIAIILFILWRYFLYVFKKNKLEYFHFILGSVGFFMFSFWLLQPTLTPYLMRLVCYLTGLLGNISGVFTAYTSYGILFIDNQYGPISLYIDFECAGLIEIIVYVALLLYFRIYTKKEKAYLMVTGVLYIIGANVIRLFVICCIIHYFGNEYYYLAHTIVGRLLFYALTVALYFNVFTSKQIRKQQSGGFEYDGKLN